VSQDLAYHAIDCVLTVGSSSDSGTKILHRNYNSNRILNFALDLAFGAVFTSHHFSFAHVPKYFVGLSLSGLQQLCLRAAMLPTMT
jgi:hypothetical protein